MTVIYKGSCLCGQVTFETSGFKDHIANCHCSMCRKFHGAAFGTLSKVKNLTWLSGQELLKDYVAPNGTIRTFCANCGSSIGFRSKGNPLSEIELSLSLFDENIPVKADAHIYTDYKSNWYEITDDLPQYKEGRE
ncbi:GFA family protein [Vibrio sp. CAIM 722]|uniref:GFA family protein n=1 Tax=Vibrio eleionomae TaxID=2653505 RepID=A0A7X4LJH5_9VIBR|nr:GFA family protein [Vibrio eleionomae]MZI93064.1 GFA family protein [Vibrio eleionomae]